jgi:hypothetical protein
MPTMIVTAVVRATVVSLFPQIDPYGASVWASPYGS